MDSEDKTIQVFILVGLIGTLWLQAGDGAPRSPDRQDGTFGMVTVDAAALPSRVTVPATAMAAPTTIGWHAGTLTFDSSGTYRMMLRIAAGTAAPVSRVYAGRYWRHADTLTLHNGTGATAPLVAQGRYTPREVLVSVPLGATGHTVLAFHPRPIPRPAP